MSQPKGQFLLKFTVLFLCLQILATALAFYGQSLALFFHEHIGGPSALVTLTITTFLSIGTFIATYMIILKAEKKRPHINFFVYLLINGLYGFFISIIALFIFAMGWG